MRNSILYAAGLTALLTIPALAQGQGGYAPGVPGADTARMSAGQRDQARAQHQTNDTAGGVSSIDKSGETQEAGTVCNQGIQGSITKEGGGSRIRCDQTPARAQ